MLTLKSIKELYKDGLEIRVNNNKVKLKHQGKYKRDGYGFQKIILYSQNIHSYYQRDRVISHEFTHALRDMEEDNADYFEAAKSCEEHPYSNIYDKELEDRIDAEARETCRKRPYVIKFIKQIYKIKCPINKRK